MKSKFKTLWFPFVDTFNEGKEGFVRNRNNPYREGTDRYREWERGYNTAYFENIINMQ
jgi:hypothetical protein